MRRDESKKEAAEEIGKDEKGFNKVFERNL